MNLQIDVFERRTSADVIFDHLRGEIGSNRLPPGAKISEVDIAEKFGVSRQPVRDAFNRLANQDLLLIRPQKPTEVRKFSLSKIRQARFIRLAVELEVVRIACGVQDSRRTDAMGKNLERQRRAVDADDIERFHELDYDFHKQICELSGQGMMFETIQFYKAKVDRLCMLSLGQASEASDLLQDHRRIFDAISAAKVKVAERAVRTHLSRLDETIREIREEHAEYFED
ncbi:GntR family transcriptional regulator [Thioalkalivibrio sp. HK1]|uniref:GntR family transcriptional regulator n=1 Tax=Thioalkalivibrio sp. HK1 TaxID=1469245 RepID=UPI0005711821|nr:GntR family transcriptional regulator [Thioalkalivibrio sp. HK1]